MNETRGPVPVRICAAGGEASHVQARLNAPTSVAALGGASATLADTADVTWQNRMVVAKEGAHCFDDPNCFNRYHPAIPAVARANPGDHIVFETRDALDSDLTLDSTADDVTALDLNLVHPMTGPVHIEGAEAGDVLAITLVDIEPDQYGYTVIVPGFGFLRDLFTEPYLVSWKLDRQAATSDEMPGVRVPIAAFMGSVGVLPGDTEVKTWLDREAALAEAGGVALPPQPIGALPATSAARTAATWISACAPSRRARTAATWTCSRCRSARRCSCPASSTAAACSSATSTRAGRRRGLGHRDRDGRDRHRHDRGPEGRRRQHHLAAFRGRRPAEDHRAREFLRHGRLPAEGEG